jgi:hypothetical protein
MTTSGELGLTMMVPFLEYVPKVAGYRSIQEID